MRPVLWLRWGIMNGTTIRRLGLFAALASLAITAPASIDQTKITLSRALNSPTLAVKYEGAKASLIELRINGESLGTRAVNSNSSSGETTFSIDLLLLKDGENDVEIALLDKDGRQIGSQKTTITAGNAQKAPLYLIAPKAGAAVMGPVEISVGFGREFRNSYVSFFIDNKFRSMSNFPPYTYVWDSSRESNGWHEIEAWVVDEASTTFKTNKLKVFVDNPGGRTNRVVAPKAEPKPLELAPAANTIEPAMGAPAGMKAAPLPGAASVSRGTNLATPALAPTLADNPILAEPEAAVGLKPARFPSGEAIGPRLLAPTGKRLAVAPAATAPVAAQPMVQPAAPKVAPPVAPKTAPAPVQPKAPEGVIAPVEADLTSATAKPVLATASLAAPTTIVALEPKRVTPTKAKAKSALVVKTAPAPTAPVVARPVSGAAVAPFLLGSFTVTIDNQPLITEVSPMIVAGVAMLPIRSVVEQLGGSVAWIPTSRSIDARAGGKVMLIRIGDRVALVNGKEEDLLEKPYVEAGRTFVPLGFLEAALGLELAADWQSNSVRISTRK